MNNVGPPQAEHRHRLVNISRGVFYHSCTSTSTSTSSTSNHSDVVVADLPCKISAVLKQHPRDFQVFEVVNDNSCRGDYLEENVLTVASLRFHSTTDQLEVVPLASEATPSREPPPPPSSSQETAAQSQEASPEEPPPFCASAWLQSLPGRMDEQFASMNELASTGWSQPCTLYHRI
jgi:hypothetical protein